MTEEEAARILVEIANNAVSGVLPLILKEANDSGLLLLPENIVLLEQAIKSGAVVGARVANGALKASNAALAIEFIKQKRA